MHCSRRAVIAACLAATALSSTLVAQQPYGNGTAGFRGLVPDLYATRPQLGDPSFVWQLRSAAPVTAAFLALGVAPASVPVGGIELALNPAGLLAVLSSFTSPTGETGFPVAIPADVSLIGAPVFGQAIVADTAGPRGLTASRGLRTPIGGDPRIFVACSILNADPYQFVDPIAGTVLDTGNAPETDNVSGAVFDEQGDRIFVASSIRGTVGVGDASALPIRFSTLFSSPGPNCYGLALDAQRQRLWTLTDFNGTGSRDLVALDADPNSPNYGAPVVSTNGLLSGNAELFALSASGDLACVLTYLPNSFTVVDLDPTSATYLQPLAQQLMIPVDQNSGFDIATRVAISPDERFALVTIQGIGNTPAEIARYDLVAGAWVDHDPSGPATNIGPLSAVPVILGSAPTTLRFSATGNFAIVGGFGSCGWIGRLDLDPVDPLVYSWTPFAPSSPLSNGWTAALSREETEVAVATWPDARCGVLSQPQLVRIDVATGSELGVVPIPSNSNGRNQNLYTLVYR